MHVFGMFFYQIFWGSLKTEGDLCNELEDALQSCFSYWRTFKRATMALVLGCLGFPSKSF